MADVNNGNLLGSALENNMFSKDKDKDKVNVVPRKEYPYSTQGS